MYSKVSYSGRRGESQSSLEHRLSAFSIVLYRNMRVVQRSVTSSASCVQVDPSFGNLSRSTSRQCVSKVFLPLPRRYDIHDASATAMPHLLWDLFQARSSPALQGSILVPDSCPSCRVEGCEEPGTMVLSRVKPNIAAARQPSLIASIANGSARTKASPNVGGADNVHTTLAKLNVPGGSRALVSTVLRPPARGHHNVMI
ncbi:uncharacterized protein B0H18DRAFT_549783 [Fomitopsis serialis]|uniref:uncharacterized protein n=1 Tax=Fomitopsis serialis TaxID=139415 RepID=UPI002008E8FE|nr:uncharacterized protein B0H18DRAFT_549783 [Neoantrodia serialis]KAH9934265.1 hypothetical protein B0H18DRAFT_549783 [Neoantrodia serialis]